MPRHWSRSARAVATALGLAALLTAAGWMIVSRWPPAGRSAALSLLGAGGPRAVPATRYLEAALAYCDQRLAQARADATSRPHDPMAHLRLAGLETNRSSLLALMSYERQRSARTTEGDVEYPRWRSQYLRQDPDRALTRAARAAEAALRTDGSRVGRPLPPRARREAYLLLASAHKELGHPSAEAHALAAAASREPDRADLWLRLAGAYARARRFSRAEAAMARAVGRE